MIEPGPFKVFVVNTDVPLYIVARIFFAHIKHRIPQFRRIAETAEKMAPKEEMGLFFDFAHHQMRPGNRQFLPNTERRLTCFPIAQKSSVQSGPLQVQEEF